jgi:adenylosuccinate lyase
VILPDSTAALDFMIAELAEILEGLRVFPDRMRANLDVGGGLAYSQNVLLALVDDGLPREDAYAIVQSAATAAWDEGRAFRGAIEADTRVTSRLSRDRVADLFDPARALRNLDVVFDRLEKIGVEDR